MIFYMHLRGLRVKAPGPFYVTSQYFELYSLVYKFFKFRESFSFIDITP